LKKSAQKTFANAGLRTAPPQPPGNRSFLLLFFKKEALASSPYLRWRLHMAVDPARAKELALALPAAAAAPHFHRVAFRTPRKIFATLDAAAGDINLMFDADLRDFFCEQAPHAFAPVPGSWGAKGATRCDLRTVDEATLTSALLAAHRLAAPKGGRK
jgi:hypothetical protein